MMLAVRMRLQDAMSCCREAGGECVREQTACAGSSTARGHSRLLGVSECIPSGKRELLGVRPSPVHLPVVHLYTQ